MRPSLNEFETLFPPPYDLCTSCLSNPDNHFFLPSLLRSMHFLSPANTANTSTGLPVDFECITITSITEEEEHEEEEESFSRSHGLPGFCRAHIYISFQAAPLAPFNKLHYKL